MHIRLPVARRRLALTLAALLTLPAAQFVGVPAGAAAETDCARVPWMNHHKSPAQRARALLAASTLDQKLRWLDEQSANNPAQTTFTTARPREVPADQFTPITFTLPAQVACTPTIQYSDAPSAIAGAGAGVTVFPANVSLSASWDTALAREKGVAMGHEAWRKQRNVLLGPGIASGRDPRSGRTSEYLGEDPVLSGLMAAAYSRGVGANPAEPVESVLKHYVANEQEIDRNNSSSNVDPRTLREIYTLPYEIAIDRGDVGGVMCAFNQVNHEWSCGSKLLLDQILKWEIGFDGWTVTDFGGRHGLTDDPPSLRAGLDQELNAWRYWTPMAIKDLISAGTLRVADVDEAAYRIVRAHIAAGLFDVPRIAAPDADISTPASVALAKTLAERGSVLLKNAGGVLPLTSRADKIAVIGPTAANTAATGDIDASSVCLHTAPNIPCSAAAPLDAITARAAPGTVSYADGSDLTAAAATAAAADVAVVFGYYQEGEFADRPNIALDGNGDALVAAVAQANPNTVVVLQTGGPVLMPWIDDVKSVLEVWYAGEQVGPATAALLFGDATPSGKLTHSFPRAEADLPTAGHPDRYPGVFADGSVVRPPGNTDPRQVTYGEGLQVGYRWYAAQDVEPLFPFGHGLSYTSFAYRDLHVDHGRDGVRVRFKLTNTGHRTGTETAQAYVELPASAHEPAKRLLGWQRVTLAPGRSTTVDLRLSAADLADLHLLQHWDGRWTTAKGRYTVTVGGSFDTALTDRFVLR